VRWIDATALRAIDPDLRSFAGANTPGEWDALLARLAEGAIVRFMNTLP